MNATLVDGVSVAILSISPCGAGEDDIRLDTAASSSTEWPCTCVRDAAGSEGRPGD